MATKLRALLQCDKGIRDGAGRDRRLDMNYSLGTSNRVSGVQVPDNALELQRIPRVGKGCYKRKSPAEKDLIT